MHFKRYSAVARLELLDGGVLQVRLAGPVTAESLQHAKQQIASRYCASEVAAFVVDFRAAAIALTGDGLDRVLAGESAESVSMRPAAMVVQPQCNDLFKAHALRIAGLHGAARRVFNDVELAVEWAREAGARRYAEHHRRANLG